jgi:hypothetical protein
MNEWTSPTPFRDRLRGWNTIQTFTVLSVEQHRKRCCRPCRCPPPSPAMDGLRLLVLFNTSSFSAQIAEEKVTPPTRPSRFLASSSSGAELRLVGLDWIAASTSSSFLIGPHHSAACRPIGLDWIGLDWPIVTISSHLHSHSHSHLQVRSGPLS